MQKYRTLIIANNVLYVFEDDVMMMMMMIK